MKKYLIITLLLFASIQLVSVEKTNPEKDKVLEIDTIEEIATILKKGCYDCHSNDTVWPGYSKIAPMSWYVYKNVTNGRKAINFSEWENIDDGIKVERMKRALATVENGMMPKPLYLKMHPEAALSEQEKEMLISWIRDDLLVKINNRIQKSNLSANNINH